MKNRDRTEARLPTRDEVLEFIRSSQTPIGHKEIARAFNLKGAQRTELRKMLKQLAGEGEIDRGHRRKVATKGALAEVTIITVTEEDLDGELFAVPANFEGDETPPKIILLPTKRHGLAPKAGDRILARLRRIGENEYEAEPIRVLKPGVNKVLGLLEPATHGAVLRPTDRRNNKDYFIATQDLKGAKADQLVLAEPLPGRALGAQNARVVEIIGSMHDPRAFSLISIHTFGIPVEFPEAALKETEGMKVPPLGKREDLRPLPLVTIDGEDARDFDDAVFAEPMDEEGFEGWWHLIVAIADVAHYVKPGSPLDRAARVRGNSVYFPDRVVPMLPERLSNDLCSLRPKEDRACMAVHLYIDQHGRLKKHRFVRALMRSAARLTYEQVQKAHEGVVDDTTDGLVEGVIEPLYKAYALLDEARKARGTLELDIAERKVIIGEDGKISSIEPRQRLDSHKLIEEFMITANVAAAEALEARQMPAMYRVHEPPPLDRIETLRQSLHGFGIKMVGGSELRPHHFTGILKQVAGTDRAQLISEIVLRSQTQAYYGPDNEGHFGLALARYCHFTSPIRRYSDILVHRALIRGYGLGEGGLSDDEIDKFDQIGKEISDTERRAVSAERDATERYTTAFMADRVGAEFPGRISGVTRFGLFVNLDETGADGLVPVSTLPWDRYTHDEVNHCLVGQETGNCYTLADRVKVKLAEADIVTGGLVFELLEGGKRLNARQTREAVKRGREAAAKRARSGGGRPGNRPARGGGGFKKGGSGRPRSGKGGRKR